jgi:hypothetical protein
LALLAVSLFGASGCYHAVVETGRPQTGAMVERKWAHSFLYGLVPPSPIETASTCPNGVAKVETQLSFLNQIANILTFGIYSPMTIQVWCAGPGSDDADAAVLSVPPGATGEDVGETLAAAVALSLESGRAVYVRLVDAE